MKKQRGNKVTLFREIVITVVCILFPGQVQQALYLKTEPEIEEQPSCTCLTGSSSGHLSSDASSSPSVHPLSLWGRSASTADPRVHVAYGQGTLTPGRAVGPLWTWEQLEVPP